MPGARDDTAYVNRIPVGNTFTLPRNTSLAARQLRIVHGILASPATLHTRVLPQLETALRDERSVVFFERNDSVPAQREAFEATKRFASEHPDIQVDVVLLDPIENMQMSLRNAWMDLPVLQYLWERYPGNDWYSVLDDDTYLLTANVRHLLGLYDPAQPVGVGETIRWGESGGYRLVKLRERGKKFVPSTRRQQHTFICGGSGIFLTRAALGRLHPVLPRCIQKHLHPAGDVRLGACMSSENVGIAVVRRREFVKDSVLRALGELELPHYFAMPAAFHRTRSAALFHRIRAVEVRRGRWGLVTWEDLAAELPPDRPSGFPRFEFYPNNYTNCTDAFGARPTPKPWNPRIKWGKKGLPPLPTPRPDALPGEWAGCDKLVGKLME